MDLQSTGGEGPRGFPDTSWGLVTRLHASGSGDYQTGLEELCRLDWKPVYCYLRMTAARTDDEAKDCTQDSFAWRIEGDTLRRYAPERGRFRR